MTGGAGFIGSHVVDALVADGREVVALDSLDRRAHVSRPEYLNPKAEYLWADMVDANAVAAAVDEVDAVSHQAAMVGLGVDSRDMPDFVTSNCLGTAVLLRALAERSFDGRLVLASSMVVYGEGRYTCERHGRVAPSPRAADRLARGEFEPACPECGQPLRSSSVPETAPADPRNTYAATKIHQEHLCAAYARELGASLIALRYHNVYGPRMPRDTPYAGVASIFRSALEAGRAPRVFEDGRQLRDFVSVHDVARANVLAIDSDSSVEGPFNVASGRPATVGEMAGRLSHVMGGPDPDVTREFRLGDVRHVFASTANAAAALGFEAEVEIDDGMREFAEAALRDPV